MQTRHLLPVDKLLIQADSALRTIFGNPPLSGRPYPAAGCTETELSGQEKKHTAGLMRINHSGEVSAQGLYQGQALTAKLPNVREKMEQAAAEENDHLVWCEQRLNDLDARKSLLNPVWYTGSFLIGATAGMLGDKWSLGFVAETEHQVVRHLDEHLGSLAEHDECSRAILEQMKIDEAKHATTALHHGGAELPAPVKKLMGLMSKVMTRTAYRV
ncbi:MAG: 2-polyprenyl-3-methyl-6-methoxy-1,4-benzoquinone monooxygenase [Pseudomonadota bacterium]|nr:2-polyprenyl-3-methyl-6-methoxy-1,4-benzoquinone monooxygenase [Pseudomonadota bacterium]